LSRGLGDVYKRQVHTIQKSQTTLPGRGYEFGFVIDTSAIGHFPYLES